jgi:predicted DNA-binding transcriptional regulator YafY
VYAVNSGTALNARYRKPNSGIEELVLRPYRVVLYHDTLYLLCEHGGALRLYHISRFDGAENTDIEFERDEGLLAKYEEDLSHSFGIHISGELKEVAIRFKKEVGYMLRERIWHDSQEIFDEGDCVVLCLRVFVNGEFLSWVKSWGDAVVGMEEK